MVFKQKTTRKFRSTASISSSKGKRKWTICFRTFLSFSLSVTTVPWEQRKSTIRSYCSTIIYSLKSTTKRGLFQVPVEYIMFDVKNWQSCVYSIVSVLSLCGSHFRAICSKNQQTITWNNCHRKELSNDSDADYLFLFGFCLFYNNTFYQFADSSQSYVL